MSSRPNEGKIAIVTGVGGSIGRETVLALADSGARVVVSSIGASLQGEGGSVSPVEETFSLIRQRGDKGLINADSVVDQDSARRTVECAIDDFGCLDTVASSAGILRNVIFHKTSADDWLSAINIHLNGSFFTSRAAAGHFRIQQAGAFVHMTSTSGLIDNFGQASYSAVKPGTVALSKSITLDTQRYSMCPNHIVPFAWSQMTDSIPAETLEQGTRVDKLQRTTFKKNAPLAVYLVPDAAREITGQAFTARHHELFLMSQNRSLRGVHSKRGWVSESIAEHDMSALRDSFMNLARNPDVFSRDSI